MNKIEYFKISNRLKLTHRCPILNRCERRLCSIYLFAYQKNDKVKNMFKYLESNGILNNISDLIPIQGETVEVIINKDNSSFLNVCPEVNLFDSEHRLTYAHDTACTSGNWDNERDDKTKFVNLESKHYSECPEFSFYSSDKLFPNNKTASKRAPISRLLRFEIFQRDNFTCQYCGRKQADGIKLHVDHKIPLSKGGADTLDNYITSCDDCNLGKSNKIIE